MSHRLVATMSRVLTFAQYSAIRGAVMFPYQIAHFGGILQGLVGFSAGELSTVEQVLRGMPIRIAVGNSHLIIAAASICAAITHLAVSASQGTQIPWNLVAITIPAVLIGGQLAGLLAGRIPQKILHFVLAGFLVFIGLLSAYRASILSGFHLPSWLLWASVLTCLATMVLFARRRVETLQGCDGVCSSRNSPDK